MKVNVKLKTCECKRAYPTKKAAKRVAKKMGRCGSKGVRPYKCVFCFQWHNGHPKENPVGADGLFIDEI